MGVFLTELNVTLLDDAANSGRGQWRLDEPLVFQSNTAQRFITVPEGFVTDFASVPRLPLVFLLVGNTCQKGSVLHDYIYRTGLLPRLLGDQVHYEANKAAGVPWWLRTLVFIGVRLGGFSSYKKKESA